MDFRSNEQGARPAILVAVCGMGGLFLAGALVSCGGDVYDENLGALTEAATLANQKTFTVNVSLNKAHPKRTRSVTLTKPAGAIRARVRLIGVYDPDFKDEGELWINGKKALTLFGSKAKKAYDGKTVSVSYSLAHSLFRNGKNVLQFRHRRTVGFKIAKVRIGFYLAECPNGSCGAPPSGSECPNGSCGAPLRSGAACSSNSDCSDGNACTKDLCSSGGKCSNEPISGCCMEDSDCSDGNPCTQDRCSSNKCSYAPISGC